MKSQPPPPIATAVLRRRAEARLRERTGKESPGAGGARATADTQRLLHELQVHQIELELQNEELRKARDEMEAGLEKYSELYDFAPVGYMTLDREGAIREANLAAASLLGIPRAPLVKQRLGNLVAPADRPVLHALLRQVFASRDRQECDLQLRVKDKPPVEVRLRANLSESGQACRVALTDITQHKRAEAVSAQLAAIVNFSSDAVIGLDLNRIITSWNAGAESIFGYTAGEMVGGPLSRLIPPRREQEEATILGRIGHGDSLEHYETVRVTKDGRWLDVSVTISPIRNATGQITGASKVARNITAHKQAENNVRVSEIRHRRLFETAHDGILLLDPRTRKITDANPLMTKLLGYPHKQLVGKELFEIGLLKDEAASQAMFQKLTRKHEVRYEDLPLESQDGRHQEVEVVANLYQENGHAVIQCNIRDITARKQAENALRLSEERYRTLFKSMDEGFCIIDMIFDQHGKPVDWRFLEVNPSFEKHNGLHAATGKRMSELAANLEPYWYETYGKVARTGKPVRFVGEAKALEGRWFDLSAFRVGGPDSRKVAIIFTNITERKQTEEALRKAEIQLSKHAAKLELTVDRRTKDLTARNRQLATALTATRLGEEQNRVLLLESQVMQKKLRKLTHQILTAQEEERKKISRELHDEVVQTLVGINVELSGLVHGNSAGVRQLKDKIARTQRLVESSVDAVHRFARELRPAVLDDLGLIPALHAYCKGLAARKKLKIQLTAFGGVERLESDKRTVLFRVAQEALTNVARHARATRVKFTISKIPGAVRMEISDNGKSFPVRKILQQRTKRLGLVGMRERVEMVGGNLTIDSVSGKGTTVRAEIPFTPEKTKP